LKYLDKSDSEVQYLRADCFARSFKWTSIQAFLCSSCCNMYSHFSRPF